MSVALTLVGDFRSRWRLNTASLASLRAALGAEVFDAFCRSFVHADRLTSLAQMVLINWRNLPHESVAYGRNALTLVWLSAGTLRELALAVRDLRSVLSRRGWLDSNLEPVKKLTEFESRWEDNALYRALRNTAAFHVDGSVIRAGVAALIARGGPVLLAEGDGGTDHETSFGVAAEALLLGVHENAEAVRAALKSVHPDHKIYLALQELFVLALQKADVSLEQQEWPGSEVM